MSIGSIGSACLNWFRQFVQRLSKAYRDDQDLVANQPEIQAALSAEPHLEEASGLSVVLYQMGILRSPPEERPASTPAQPMDRPR